MDQSRIRIGMLDDHAVVLESVAARINQSSDMEVVCAESSSEEGLKAILATRPTIALLDVDLPGRGSFEIARDIRAKLPGTKIMFLSGFFSDVFLEQALRIRARAYLLKGEPAGVLLDSIRKVAQGGYYFSPKVEARLSFDATRKQYALREPNALSCLTARQIEVLRHLAGGESVKEVAKLLHLSQKSVDSHKYRIMQKLGIHDRVQLARFAIREGLMVP